MERIIAYTMSIKFTKDEMNNMEEMLKTFLDDNNITLQPPVDIFKIATELGFDIRGAEFKDDLDGLLLVDETSKAKAPFTSNKVIVYNCTKSIDHKKFIVGHELAHYIEAKYVNPKKQIVCAAREHAVTYGVDKDEQRKDYISAAILMPKEHVQKMYRDEERESGDVFYKQVAKDFNVSTVMARRRIEEVFDEL